MGNSSCPRLWPVSDPAAWNRSLGEPSLREFGSRSHMTRGTHVGSGPGNRACPFPPDFVLTYRDKWVHRYDHRYFCDTGAGSTHDMTQNWYRHRVPPLFFDGDLSVLVCSLRELSLIMPGWGSKDNVILCIKHISCLSPIVAPSPCRSLSTPIGR
ncbi:hypothetical protein VUR80DRAFT_566 [Thermomyces stellatus]